MSITWKQGYVEPWAHQSLHYKHLIMEQLYKRYKHSNRCVYKFIHSCDISAKPNVWHNLSSILTPISLPFYLIGHIPFLFSVLRLMHHTFCLIRFIIFLLTYLHLICIWALITMKETICIYIKVSQLWWMVIWETIISHSIDVNI